MTIGEVCQRSSADWLWAKAVGAWATVRCIVAAPAWAAGHRVAAVAVRTEVTSGMARALRETGGTRAVGRSRVAAVDASATRPPYRTTIRCPFHSCRWTGGLARDQPASRPASLLSTIPLIALSEDRPPPLGVERPGRSAGFGVRGHRLDARDRSPRCSGPFLVGRSPRGPSAEVFGGGTEPVGLRGRPLGAAGTTEGSVAPPDNRVQGDNGGDDGPKRRGQGEVQIRHTLRRTEQCVEDAYSDLRPQEYQPDQGEDLLGVEGAFLSQERHEGDDDERPADQDHRAMGALEGDQSPRCTAARAQRKRLARR